MYSVHDSFYRKNYNKDYSKTSKFIKDGKIKYYCTSDGLRRRRKKNISCDVGNGHELVYNSSEQPRSTFYIRNHSVGRNALYPDEDSQFSSNAKNKNQNDSNIACTEDQLGEFLINDKYYSRDCSSIISWNSEGTSLEASKKSSNNERKKVESFEDNPIVDHGCLAIDRKKFGKTLTSSDHVTHISTSKVNKSLNVERCSIHEANNVDEQGKIECFKDEELSSTGRDDWKTKEKHINGIVHFKYNHSINFYSELPLEWWDRTDDCKDAKALHLERIDHLDMSREELILETTLWKEDIVLERNMFPYDTPYGIEHYTLWSIYDMTHQNIVEYVNSWLSYYCPDVRRWQYDDNSGERSIDLFHVHVFIEMIPYSFTIKDPEKQYIPSHSNLKLMEQNNSDSDTL